MAKGKVVDIRKIICQEENELMLTEEGITTRIVDAELDIIDCIFNYDDCVQLNTEGYSYITLSKKNLSTLIKLINASTKAYDEGLDEV
jgi:hypothetical protein